jgi:hypothetical protein
MAAVHRIRYIISTWNLAFEEVEFRSIVQNFRDTCTLYTSPKEGECGLLKVLPLQNFVSRTHAVLGPAHCKISMTLQRAAAFSFAGMDFQHPEVTGLQCRAGLNIFSGLMFPRAKQHSFSMTCRNWFRCTWENDTWHWAEKTTWVQQTFCLQHRGFGWLSCTIMSTNSKVRFCFASWSNHFYQMSWAGPVFVSRVHFFCLSLFVTSPCRRVLPAFCGAQRTCEGQESRNWFGSRGNLTA